MDIDVMILFAKIYYTLNPAKSWFKVLRLRL
jgi:hypothetical protein